MKNKEKYRTNALTSFDEFTFYSVHVDARCICANTCWHIQNNLIRENIDFNWKVGLMYDKFCARTTIYTCTCI